MLLASDELYRVHHGETIQHMAGMPSRCVDAAITSPPFPTLYSYSNSDADIGNSEDMAGDAFCHLSFFYRQFARILKPGRVAMIHVMQIPRMKRAGGQGLFDFRGFNIRLAERAGLIYEYDWAVRKNPQAQAITTHSHELQFSGLERDRARSRGCLPDYLIKFTAPGDNAVAVDDDESVSRNDWIILAECTWNPQKYPVNLAGKKAMTLNVEEARGPEDTRHVCPMQLSVVDQLVRLYTNPGEIVFDPFAGIGSTGFPAMRRGRRFYGVEMKSEYHRACLGNLDRAVKMYEEIVKGQRMLFGEGDEEPVNGELAESLP